MERCLAADEVTAWTASPAADGEDGTPPERMGDVWEHVIEDEVSTVVVRLRPEDPIPSRPLPPVMSWSWTTGEEALRGVVAYVARHHPARVMAELTGGRKLVEAYRAAKPGSERRDALHLALRALAVGHADHKDFDPAWRLWSEDDSSTWP